MPGLIERYRQRLPFAAGDPVVTLQEGATPLVLAPRLSERAGTEVWLKLEGANPTGSFKDRGMTCAVSAAVREGARAVVCASTGNTAASAAAYAARAGLRGVVIVPEGKIATGKLAQALVHGARVIALRGNFDHALKLVRELVDRHPIALVNSVNEFRIEGQKTAAFEIGYFFAGHEVAAGPALRQNNPMRPAREPEKEAAGGVLRDAVSALQGLSGVLMALLRRVETGRGDYKQVSTGSR